METRREEFKSISLGRVLDVGTGLGSFIPILKDFFKDYAEIIGIDRSEKGLERARQSFTDEKIKFMNMNAEHMSFTDGEFDTVCISNSLHHLEDISKVLGEMKRVLKPEGLLIINEMFSDNQSEKQMSHVFIHHLHGEIDTLLGNYHGPTYKKEEIVQIARDTGLTIEAMVEYNTHEEQLGDENLEEEMKVVENSLKAAEDRLEGLRSHERHEILSEKLEDLKKILNKRGIFGATELLILGRYSL